MNEININIEGYNVNGICVGCLNYNRKMYSNEDVQECFNILGNIEVPDGLTIQVCWECLAHVRRVKKFQNRIQKAYNVLMEYSKQHTFLNSPQDLTRHALPTLTVTKVTPMWECTEHLYKFEVPIVHVPEASVDVVVVKEEVEYDGDLHFEDVDDHVPDESKDEPLKLESEVQDYTKCDDFGDAAPGHIEDLETDEENIKLSKLKRKKEKRDKREKKKTKSDKPKKKKTERTKDSKERRALQLKGYRKLKNLPENIVQLVNMTEKEMWEIRRQDVENPDFVKLKYKCCDCIIGFNTEKLMTDHMAGKHTPKGKSCSRCDVCRAYFLTADNAHVHRALHRAAYACAPCGFRTGLKRLMARHVAARHRPRARADAWPCTLCDQLFSTKSKLSYHRGICHQERPQCDCCGKVFANKMTLKYHLKILPYDKSESKPKEKLHLPCKGCGKVFHSKKSYRAHVVIHDGLEYPCPVCGKLFQWKRNLARHLRNHSERATGTLYECRPCKKRFSSKDCFNNHMKFSKRHVSEDAYVHQCSYCSKRFPTKWCMVDHIDWDHLKKIKYQCQVCLKAFKTAKIMVAHINNIHERKKNAEPEGEHLCDICGKSYKTVKRLKGHVWAMHTHRSTAKSYRCKLCPATFTWQTSIYKHVKMMHENPKRGKNARPQPPPPKKPRPEPVPYEGLELTNRMQYFQHNIVLDMNAQSAAPAGLAANIV